MSIASLTERGIYLLPDGEEVIACFIDDGYVLYTHGEWRDASTADYEIDADGRITFQGEPTGWLEADLTDTWRIKTT